MRALLVVNPKATTTSKRTRDALIEAMRDDLLVDVQETGRRGHATELGRQAVENGVDVVVVLGGDGSVNEVVNGLLGARSPHEGAAGPHAGPELPEPDPAGRPALAVVPVGSGNVFARSLGISLSPIEATGKMLYGLRIGRHRVIGVGRANDRYFTFCAGLGLDAEVVDKVEVKRQAGLRATPSMYARTAVAHFFRGADRRDPTLTLERPGEEPVDRLFLGIVANNAPWTYFGAWPINPCPRASFDTGLDLLAARRLDTLHTLRAVAQMVARVPNPRGQALVLVHDAPEFTMTASRPVALQVDGDYLGKVEQAVFRSVPRALRVVI